MSHNFRIEPVKRIGQVHHQNNNYSIKVYSKSNANLPLDIDVANRYAIFFAHGEQFLDRIQNFKVRADDVWVVTMPKCGTTWMLELIWLLQNNLDYETALRVEQEDRCIFLEYCAIIPEIKPHSLDVADQLESPRVIKSHLPIHLLPKGLWTVKPKIIYVSRDPKDAAVSYHHFLSCFIKNPPNKEDFLNAFLDDEMRYNPFWLHVVEFWMLRNESYVYFTSFERMKKNLILVVEELSEFLKKPINEQQKSKLLEHLSFEKMKDNPACNHLTEIREAQKVNGTEKNPFKFLRKGTVGSHRDDLTEEMIRKFDNWTEKALKPYNVTDKEILIL